MKEIQKTPAEIVYVLPNNKNIILAAQQCVDLVEDKKVVVLQAKTVPQGISAMIAMNPDGEEAENTAAMEEAMGQVTTMEITYAARDSSFDGNAIQAGDYLLLVDNIARLAMTVEVPIGILTAILGVPFFVVIFKHNMKGWR